MAFSFDKLRTVPKEKLAAAAPMEAWKQQISDAIDWSSASGDAWGKIGKEGVINYMGDSLKKRYGTNNMSDFRFIEDAKTPGGYQLDWNGRQPVTGFLGGIKDASRSAGIAMGPGAGSGSDNEGSLLARQDPSKALNFGATWEGKGGTTFGFYRKPDGSVGIKTNQTQSNETADIIAAASILAGGYMAGTGAIGGTAAGGAGAAEGAAAGAATGYVGPTSFGVLDQGLMAELGMQSGVGLVNGGMSFGVLDQGIAANASTIAQGGSLAGASAGGVGGGGGGGGGATSGGTAGGGATTAEAGSTIEKLGAKVLNSKLGSTLLSAGASKLLGSLMTPDSPDMPSAAPSGARDPGSITKAVSEMPDPVAQQRARRRSVTEQLGRRGRASTIMTRPGGRLGG